MTSSQVKLSRQIPRSFVVEMLAENWQQGVSSFAGLLSQHSALNCQKSTTVFSRSLINKQRLFQNSIFQCHYIFEKKSFYYSIHNFICALCSARPEHQLLTFGPRPPTWQKRQDGLRTCQKVSLLHTGLQNCPAHSRAPLLNSQKKIQFKLGSYTYILLQNRMNWPATLLKDGRFCVGPISIFTLDYIYWTKSWQHYTIPCEGLFSG